MATNTLKQQQWSDFDPLLTMDTTGRVIKVRDDECLARSIKNILLTMRNSRVRNNIGSDLFRVLFKAVNERTAEEIESIITTVVPRHDNRIGDIDVRVIPNTREEYYEIQIRFRRNDTLTYSEIITFLEGRIRE